MCLAVKVLPRIKVRPGACVGEFYNSVTGDQFYPEGNNYIKLYWADEDNSFHSNFIEGMYDAADAELALTKMEQGGYTVVRVFVYPGHWKLRALDPPIYCVGGYYWTPNSDLSAVYMDNFIDFLTKASNHNIYVHVVLDACPDNSYYYNMVYSGTPDVNGWINRKYLADGAVEAKKIYLTRFVQYIKAKNSDLLTTILGYELQNEVNCTTEHKPFSMSSGMVTTADGNTYDMSNAVSRQACMDNNINYWANECTAAIKTEDPNALVFLSIFPFSAVGKNEMAGDGLLPILTTDRRWPARPLKLMETSLDFIDIHFYCVSTNWWNVPISDHLNSCEWSSIDKTVMPFYAGEIGIHRNALPDVKDSADTLGNFREEIYENGFSGASLFTWDLADFPVHRPWFMAMDLDEMLYDRLKPANRHIWNFNRADNYLEGWTLKSGINSAVLANRILSLNLGSNPYIDSPFSQIGIDSSEYHYLTIRIKNQTSATQGQLFWIANNDRVWGINKSQIINIVPNDATFREYVIDLKANPSWDNTINQIRFAPAIGVSMGQYEIDYIKIESQEDHIRGDLSGDSTVNFRDFAILGGNWQKNLMTWIDGDLNNDLAVNENDIEIIANYWLQP